MKKMYLCTLLALCFAFQAITAFCPTSPISSESTPLNVQPKKEKTFLKKPWVKNVLFVATAATVMFAFLTVLSPDTSPFSNSETSFSSSEITARAKKVAAGFTESIERSKQECREIGTALANMSDKIINTLFSYTPFAERVTYYLQQTPQDPQAPQCFDFN
ncbi:MAG TPA: hypothetical protein VEK38_04150 [Candidatus Bathyarchaeia archaeon]|nr:hypothetical protein [Candidatus Bathyarchaeia archaeon]